MRGVRAGGDVQEEAIVGDLVPRLCAQTKTKNREGDNLQIGDRLRSQHGHVDRFGLVPFSSQPLSGLHLSTSSPTPLQRKEMVRIMLNT